MFKNILFFSAPAVIKYADPVHFYSNVLFFLFGVIVSLYLCYLFLLKVRIIEDTPTSKIRSAAQGYVKLCGEQKYFIGKPLISPFTQKSCTWYKYEIGQYRRGNWIQIECQCSDNLIEMYDETDVCLIDTKGAEIIVPIDAIHYWEGIGKSRTLANIPTSSTKVSYMPDPYIYKEYVMNDDELLYVMGHFETVSTKINPLYLTFYKEVQIKKLLDRWKKNKGKLLSYFKKDEKDNLTEEEWQVVSQIANKRVNKQISNNLGYYTVNVISNKNRADRYPFIVSAINEIEAINMFQLEYLLYVSLFLISLSNLGWLLQARFT